MSIRISGQNEIENYFDTKKNLDKKISELVFSNNPIAWSKIKEILDIYTPILMRTISNIPAYIIIMKETGIEPSEIKNFDDFNKKMPVITPSTYFRIINTPNPNNSTKRLGINAFSLRRGGASYVYHDKDVSNQHNLTKGKVTVTTIATFDDVTGSAIGLAGALFRHSIDEKSWLANNARIDNNFVNEVLNQAIVYYSSVQLNNSCLEKLHSYGDPSNYWGLFPTHINNFIVPFPNLIYPVDKNGRRTDLAGTLVVSNLFSVSEKPFGVYSILKRGIETIIQNINEKSFTQDMLQRLIGDYYYKVLTDLLRRDIKDLEDLQEVYRFAILNWIKHDLVWNSPQGTIFLKFAIPRVGIINDYGEILHEEAVPKTTTIRNGTVFIYRHSDYPIKHEVEFLKNIIARNKKDSPISVRVYDITEGKHDYHFPNGREYLYIQPCVLKKDIDEAILWTRKKGNIILELSTTVEDVNRFLENLHQKVSEDIELQKLFVRKSGIPIAEVREMLIEAKKLIEIKNLKKLAYASLINNNVNFDELSDEEIEKGIESIKSKMPQSPVYLVTAGNMNFLDWFKIMAELLLVTLSKKPLIYNIRPSESDVISSYSLYFYEDIVLERIPDAVKKGLKGLFQRLFWNPNIHQEYGLKLIQLSGCSISFGTLKSFVCIRSVAAYNAAVNSKKFDQKELRNLLLYGTIRKDGVRILTIDSVNKAFLKQKISEPICEFIKDYINKHILYQETINAAIVLSGISNLNSVAQQILEKNYKLHSSDCLSLQNVFVHESVYNQIFSILKEKASELICGDITNENVQLSWYSPDELDVFMQNLKNIISDYELVCPRNIDGLKVKESELLQECTMGVILAKFDLRTTSDQNINENLIKNWLAKQHGFPIINLICFKSDQELLKGIKDIKDAFKEQTDYGAYTYISIFGDIAQIRTLKHDILSMTDLILENTLKFNPLQPHNRRYFLRDVLGLGPIGY